MRIPSGVPGWSSEVVRAADVRPATNEGPARSEAERPAAPVEHRFARRPLGPVAKLGVAATLALGVGFGAHAGQRGSELGATSPPAAVRGVELDLSPALISSSVQATLQEEERRAQLFRLPTPELAQAPAEDRADGTPARAVHAMKRIMEILVEEPWARERLATNGSVTFSDLTLGQQNHLVDVLLETAGLHEALGGLLASTGGGAPGDGALAQLWDRLDLIVDPTAPGATGTLSFGRPDRAGRIALTLTYDASTTRVRGEAERHGLEAGLNYRLDF